MNRLLCALLLSVCCVPSFAKDAAKPLTPAATVRTVVEDLAFMRNVATKCGFEADEMAALDLVSKVALTTLAARAEVEALDVAAGIQSGVKTARAVLAKGDQAAVCNIARDKLIDAVNVILNSLENPRI